MIESHFNCFDTNQSCFDTDLKSIQYTPKVYSIQTKVISLAKVNLTKKQFQLKWFCFCSLSSDVECFIHIGSTINDSDWKNCIIQLNWPIKYGHLLLVMTIIVVAIFDVTLMCFVECNEYNFDLGSWWAIKGRVHPRVFSCETTVGNWYLFWNDFRLYQIDLTCVLNQLRFVSERLDSKQLEIQEDKQFWICNYRWQESVENYSHH